MEHHRMEIFYSELCLIGGAVEDNVDRLIAGGAENIELMLDGAGWDDFPRRMDGLVPALRAKKANYSVHVPVWDVNLTCSNAHLRAAVLETYRQSIVLAARLDARHIVLHTGWCSDPHFSKDQARGWAREAMLALHEFNAAYGQNLLVENVGTNVTSLFTEDQFLHFLDGFPEDFGYLVDAGHAYINGWNLDTLFARLGKRIRAIHIHDNDGLKDRHAPIGEGNMDWKSILAAASATGLNLNLVLEYTIGTELSRLTAGKAFVETCCGAGR
jgi:sugar phosphate isomerase/epimerase